MIQGKLQVVLRKAIVLQEALASEKYSETTQVNLQEESTQSDIFW